MFGIVLTHIAITAAAITATAIFVSLRAERNQSNLLPIRFAIGRPDNSLTEIYTRLYGRMPRLVVTAVYRSGEIREGSPRAVALSILSDVFYSIRKGR